jgi:hypothetical protein
VVQTLTHFLSTQLDLGDTPDWSNGEAMKSWLLNIKLKRRAFFMLLRVSRHVFWHRHSEELNQLARLLLPLFTEEN